MTNRKSGSGFLMSLRRIAYVTFKPLKGAGCKNTKWPKDVCYSLFLYKNFQRESYKAFTGLSNSAQMVGGGHPLKRKSCSDIAIRFGHPDYLKDSNNLAIRRRSCSVSNQGATGVENRDQIRTFWRPI